MHDTAQHNLFQVTKSKLHDLHYYYSGRWNPTNACMQHACLLNNELVWKELKKNKDKKNSAFAPMLCHPFLGTGNRQRLGRSGQRGKHNLMPPPNQLQNIHCHALCKVSLNKHPPTQSSWQEESNTDDIQRT